MSWRRKSSVIKYNHEADLNSKLKQTCIDSFYCCISKSSLVKKSDITPNKRKPQPIKYEDLEKELSQASEEKASAEPLSEQQNLITKAQPFASNKAAKNLNFNKQMDKEQNLGEPQIQTVTVANRHTKYEDLDNLLDIPHDENGYNVTIETTNKKNMIVIKDKDTFLETSLEKCKNDNLILDEPYMPEKCFKVTISPLKHNDTNSEATLSDNSIFDNIKDENDKENIHDTVTLPDLLRDIIVNQEECKIITASQESDTTIIYNPNERTPEKQFTIPQKEINVTPSPSKKAKTKRGSPVKRKLNIHHVDKNIENFKIEDNCKYIKKVINWFFNQHHLVELFTEREKTMLKNFMSLPSNYQILCFRLFKRIHKWYNVFKLCTLINLEMQDYDIKYMYQELSKNKFLDNDLNVETTESLLNHLQLSDLKGLCDNFKIKKKSVCKDALKEALLNNAKKQTTLFSTSSDQILKAKAIEKLGICVKLNGTLRDLLTRIHLIYAITNPDMDNVQELYYFMLKIHNHEIILPTYKIDSIVLFPTREDFIRFTESRMLAHDIQDAIDVKKNKTLVHELASKAYEKFNELDHICLRSDNEINPILRRFTAGNNYVRAIFNASKYISSENYEEVAVWLKKLLEQTIYGQYKRGAWYSQLAKVQEVYLKDLDEAGKTVIQGLQDPNVTEIFKHDLVHRGEALKNRKNNKLTELILDQLRFQLVEIPQNFEFPIHVMDANAVNWTEYSAEMGQKRRYLDPTEDGMHFRTVEDMALSEYRKLGYPNGIHCEGALLNTLFYVLFWDIIYDYHVHGMFITEIQMMPLDLRTPLFYLNRKDVIDQRLKDVECLWKKFHLYNYVAKQWENHCNEIPLIGLNINEANDLVEIVDCIGRNVLSGLLKRLVSNIGIYHSGLPDLFVWNPETCKCKFVEVKGEKDKLSMKQNLWLEYMLKIGADAEVCHVHTIGSRRSKKEVIKH